MLRQERRYFTSMGKRAHVFRSTFHFHEENNDCESANKMSQEFLETNKAIALRLVEVFNGRRLDLLEDVLHPEFRGRGISAFTPGGPEVGPCARRKLYEMFYQAIPDARAEVLDVVAEGDKVVIVDRFGGTHCGEFFGRPGTGDRIEWMAIHIYTIRDGKVLEDAVMTEALAIMQHLGLGVGLPFPETKPETENQNTQQ
jgi:predicted ester cyclase